jgi:hypothetical protein
MYQVIFKDSSCSKLFALLTLAKTFAKASGNWYYIIDKSEVIYTQDDEIFEILKNR